MLDFSTNLNSFPSANRSLSGRAKLDGRRRGFTLIELLITISILAILVVIVVPSVRIMSKDRQAREAARVVGATFASAQGQAVADGMSGVWIERNPNVQAGNASTRIFQVRAPRPFTGYGANSKAILPSMTEQPGDPFYTVHIPARALFDPDPPNLPLPDSLFQLNDFIQLNHRGALYRVVNLAPAQNQNFTEVTFVRGPADPPPPLPETGVLELPFKIFRRPVKIPSTATDLPRGYMIDLSVSGHGPFGFQFFDPAATLADPATEEIVIIFDNNGGIDAIYPLGLNGPPVVADGTLYLMIAEIDVETGVPTIFNQRNHWVTVNRLTGQSSIANMATPNTGDPIEQQLADARSISRTGVQANQ